MIRLHTYARSLKNGNNYAEIHLQRKKLLVSTLASDQPHSIGEKVPDRFMWTLNYRTYLNNESDLDEVEAILDESYQKR